MATSITLINHGNYCYVIGNPKITEELKRFDGVRFNYLSPCHRVLFVEPATNKIQLAHFIRLTLGNIDIRIQEI
jgi:hypothetical protein